MQETVKKVLNGDFNRKKALLFLITALLTVIVWNLPIDSFGIEGLTIVQQRVIAIFVMAVMLWLTEAIPAWATSVVIIFVCCSSSATPPLRSCKARRQRWASCSTIRV